MTPAVTAGRAVFVTAMLAVVAGLVWLGSWQLQRAAWKNDVLARIDRAESGSVVRLTTDDLSEVSPSDLRHVAVDGTLTGPALAVHDVADGVLGHRLVFGLDLGASTLLVDAGALPVSLDDAPVAVAPTRTVTLTGYLGAPPRAGGFVPENDAALNRWYRWDVPAMSAALGLSRPASGLLRLSRPIEGYAVGGVRPTVTETLPRPHNRHLGYALTWFGLAGTVLVALAAWLWSQRPRRPA